MDIADRNVLALRMFHHQKLELIKLLLLMLNPFMKPMKKWPKPFAKCYISKKACNWLRYINGVHKKKNGEKDRSLG